MIHMHTATVKRKAATVQNSRVDLTPEAPPPTGEEPRRRRRRDADVGRGEDGHGHGHGEGGGDGRRRRWEEHKRARREEFVTAAVEAIRLHGNDVGLDDIARQAGVSKPVLYRHFTDKADEDLLRGAVSAYVGLVVQEPQLYQFVFTHNALGTQGDFVANMEDVIAQGLSALMADRLRRSGADSGGAEPWAYGVVGMVQLAAHRWMKHQVMSAEALVDYLVALVWQGLSGVLPPKEDEETTP